jgi:hypothetical protein
VLAINVLAINVLAINVLAINVLAIDVLAIARGLRNGGRAGHGKRACPRLADRDRPVRAAATPSKRGRPPSSVSSPDCFFTHLCCKDTIHVQDGNLVTRGYTGEISRWRLPNPAQVIAACSGHPPCAILP